MEAGSRASMSHAHDQGHPHAGGEAGRRRLLIAIGIGSVVLVAELVGGLLANSLLLLSDAAHVFNDLLSLGLSAVAATFALRPPTLRKSFGFYRAEVLAAFVNALLLWGAAAYIAYEALHRLSAPPAVRGDLIVLVGLLGLAANLLMAGVLWRGRKENINIRSAYLHVLSDAFGSVAAVAGGLAIVLFNVTWVDPFASLLVVALLAFWTWRLTKDTVHILLEGVPHRVDPERLRRDLLGVPGVLDIHDLHVWSLTRGVDSMSAHALVKEGAEPTDVVCCIQEIAKENHGIGHVTVQVERDPGHACGHCSL